MTRHPDVHRESGFLFLWAARCRVFFEPKGANSRISAEPKKGTPMKNAKSTPKTVAVWIEKGGSGKTTTTVHTAAILADMGKRVLIVDADFQASASLHYCVNGADRSLAEVLEGTVQTAEAIFHTNIPGLDLLPAAHRLEDIDETLSQEGAYVLKDALETVGDSYDIIFIDCNPAGPKHLKLNIMAASDGLVIPIDIGEYAMEGLLRVNDTVQEMRRTVNRSLEVLGVLVTKDERGIIKQGYQAQLRDQTDLPVFRTSIRKNAAIGKAEAARMPVHRYEKKSKAAQDYTDFANELLEVLV